MHIAEHLTDAEDLYRKVLQLDASGRQILDEFLEFLLTRHRDATVPEPVFRQTSIEDVTTPSVYHGPALTLEQMRAAIDWEAGQRP